MRLAKGLSQVQLGNLVTELGLPLNHTQVSTIERCGYKKGVSVDRLMFLARALCPEVTAQQWLLTPSSREGVDQRLENSR
ncbi:hypothetical protein [Shimazuella kribbensis]|uniref:hypothetical protein n=1 Tax=Shimazuella kribbensis TaxID=139808 RepID=UPI00147183C8|nr:hypothetical protein [Shimazuella kribbensis]